MEQLPSAENLELMRLRNRALEVLRERGVEDGEAKMAFLYWKTFNEEFVQRPKEEAVGEWRLRELQDVFKASESFDEALQRLQLWEAKRKSLEGNEVKRVSDPEAQIRLIMDEADLYREAGFGEEAYEVLENAWDHLEGEKQGTLEEYGEGSEQYRRLLALEEELRAKF